MRVLSLAVPMLTHSRRSARLACRIVPTVLFAALVTSSCDKVPLLAPTGTVITLFSAASSGSGTSGTGTSGTGATGTTGTTTTTTAGAGTPVQNGTLVSFTTTLGRIEPSEARTSNGQVRVRFFPGNQSGTATITAFSGGASGKLENLKVGSAA